MTGPEHYQEAEGFLVLADEAYQRFAERRTANWVMTPVQLTEANALAALAQAHATLALAASNRDDVDEVTGTTSMSREWAGVLG